MALEFRVAGLGENAVDYLSAWDLQRDVHAGVVAGDPDTVLYLEHPPVFTAGKRTDPHERPLDPGGADVIDVDRGGKITFHGPGQLVGYPIVRLPGHVKVVDYVRRVEEALIRVCADFGVETARVPGRSGAWLRADDNGPERKIGAIGLRVSKGVTMHGFALNCDVDLAWYDRFVPCGISDAGVTSLSGE
ncbi:MAG: lipoyl(octanoyl) transferase LipB, partial [Nocardioides sp.]|nr:lipoyl(octanoyl) transferase LipB [Nocardioides sp.]